MVLHIYCKLEGLEQAGKITVTGFKVAAIKPLFFLFDAKEARV